MVADYMHGDSFPGPIVNDKDNTRVEGHDRAQFVGYQRDGVVHVQRGTNCLGDLVERKHLPLGLSD